MRRTAGNQDSQTGPGVEFGSALPAFRSPSAKRLLLKAFWRKNKTNNLILLCTVSLIVFLAFGILSVIPGKIHADRINHICRAGTCADAYIENGTEDLSKRMKGISFVEEIGFEKQIGTLEIAAAKNADTVFCEGVVLDEQTFQTMIAPALIRLVGDCPERKNEILLPLETLNQMGINSPQVGMTILLHMDGQPQNIENMPAAGAVQNMENVPGAEAAQNIENVTGPQEFVLSGYYDATVEMADAAVEMADAAVETSDAAGRMPRAFLSEAYLSSMGAEMYPCRILMQTDGSFLNGEQMETLLSNELWMWMDAGQYIVANDSAAYVAVSSTIGNYRIGVAFCIFLFLFVFFILYNLRAVSLSSDIRTFAGFQTIGVSRKEIRQIFNGQTWIIWLAGSAIGTVLGSVAALYLFPAVLRTLYLDPERMTSVFNPRLFLLILPLVGVMMAAASGMAMRRMEKISLREAQEYVEASNGESRKRGLERICRGVLPVSGKQNFPSGVKLQVLTAKRNRQNVVCHLARTGVFRSKKACFIRVCTLFLGWEMILCAVMMSTGLDMTGNRMMYAMICLFLLLAGIVNEISATATDLTSRKREFFLLGQIGMTEKQIRKMLMLESLIYFGMSTGLVITSGNLFLFLLQLYLKKQTEYFRFVYPLKAWVIVFFLLGAVAVLIPQMVYRTGSREK